MIDIKDWVDWNPLTTDEMSLLRSHYDFNIQNNTKNDDLNYTLKKEFFNLLEGNNNLYDIFNIQVANNATDIITSLFEKYVDDDTIIISTNCEHPSVNSNLDKYQNKIILNYEQTVHNPKYKNNFFIPDFSECKKFKRAFIYIVGTFVGFGSITPNQYYLDIKNILENMGLETILVCDDVQGMFLIPRDYSIFDYVVGTGHAMAIYHNMGILLAKDKLLSDYITTSNDALDLYLKKINIVLKRKEKINIFSRVVGDSFKQYINLPIIKNDVSNNFERANNLYTIQIRNKIFNEKEEKNHWVALDGLNTKKALITRFRAQEYIHYPEELILGINFVKNRIDWGMKYYGF